MVDLFGLRCYEDDVLRTIMRFAASPAVLCDFNDVRTKQFLCIETGTVVMGDSLGVWNGIA